MPNISLRDLDAPTLSRIRTTARRRNVSVNRLIVETLREHYAAGSQVFDDLDALAGTWSKSESKAFEAAVAPFAETDPGLWAPSAKSAARGIAPAKGRKQP